MGVFASSKPHFQQNISSHIRRMLQGLLFLFLYFRGLHSYMCPSWLEQVQCAGNTMYCEGRTDPITGCPKDQGTCVEATGDSITGDTHSCLVICPVHCNWDIGETDCGPLMGPDGCYVSNVCALPGQDCPREVYDSNGCEVHPGGTMCPQDQMVCAGTINDASHCRSQETCMPLDSECPVDTFDDRGCPIVMPIECPAGQMVCMGTISDASGCYGPDTCQDEGSECPVDTFSSDGCEIHDEPSCNEGSEIQCYGGYDHSTWCSYQDICVPWDPEGIVPFYCPKTSCNPLTEMVCAWYDEYGNIEDEYCMENIVENNRNYGSCPAYCASIFCEMICPGTLQQDGCYGPSTCANEGMCPSDEYDVWGCMIQTPPECDPDTEILIQCIDVEGCSFDECHPNMVGGCPAMCEPPCQPEETLCQDFDTETGCQVRSWCMPPTYDIWHGNLCPATCPMMCFGDEKECYLGHDSNGCDMGSQCFQAVDECPKEEYDVFGCYLPLLQDVECLNDEVICYGVYDYRGCYTGDTCMPVKSGQCWNYCPASCEWYDKECGFGRYDGLGCPMSTFCVPQSDTCPEDLELHNDGTYAREINQNRN